MTKKEMNEIIFDAIGLRSWLNRLDVEAYCPYCYAYLKRTGRYDRKHTYRCYSCAKNFVFTGGKPRKKFIDYDKMVYWEDDFEDFIPHDFVF